MADACEGEDCPTFGTRQHDQMFYSAKRFRRVLVTHLVVIENSTAVELQRFSDSTPSDISDQQQILALRNFTISSIFILAHQSRIKK
jgi:hypothetical protein